jgi:hypothetical protein
VAGSKVKVSWVASWKSICLVPIIILKKNSIFDA